VEQVAARAQRPVINKTELDADAGYCTAEGENPLLAVFFDMYTGDGVSIWRIDLAPAQVLFTIEYRLRTKENTLTRLMRDRFGDILQNTRGIYDHSL